MDSASSTSARTPSASSSPLKEYLPSSLAERSPGELTPRVKPEKQPLYRLGLKSFFEEGRSLAQISHTSVVSVLNFFRENETVYMVMNYLQGDTLQDFIVTARDLKRDKVFRESTIRSLFDEILRGLRIVHQHKMLHLDIKPANIFITNDNKAVLLDFGAAREVLSKEGNFIRPMYTPGFAAPEMYRRDGTLGPWTDIYAIGACIYACMQGYPPNDAPQRIEKDRLALSLSRLRNVYSRQPDRGHRVVHVARPAVAAAERVRAAEGAGARDRAPLHQAQLQRAAEAAAREHHLERQGLSPRPEPCASPSIRSAARAAARRTKTGWATATRATSGLFALADGMGGHPEGEVASQLALQTLAAMFQRDCKPTLPDPLRFLHESIIAGHHQLLRYATQKALIDTPRTTVVACLLQGNAAYWAHCGDSRLYLVRGDKLIARTRDHSYSELQQTMSQVVPMGDRFNRNVLFTCLGSPGKPVVDTVGPLLLQAGRPAAAVLRRPVGHGQRQRDHRPARQPAGLRRGARAGRAGAAQRRRQVRQRHGARGRVGRRRGQRQRPRHLRPTALGEAVFASTIQAGVLGTDVASDELDDAEIERSIAEINEAIRRSAQAEEGLTPVRPLAARQSPP